MISRSQAYRSGEVRRNVRADRGLDRVGVEAPSGEQQSGLARRAMPPDERERAVPFEGQRPERRLPIAGIDTLLLQVVADRLVAVPALGEPARTFSREARIVEIADPLERRDRLDALGVRDTGALQPRVDIAP